jgi:hypothetical protein
MRKIVRRRAWIEGWRRLAAHGRISRHEAQREVRALEQDIRSMLASIGGFDTTVRTRTT